MAFTHHVACITFWHTPQTPPTRDKTQEVTKPQQTAPNKAKAQTTFHFLTGSGCRGEPCAHAAVPAKKQAQRTHPTPLPTAAALAPVGSVHHSKRTDQNLESRLKGARECGQREHTATQRDIIHNCPPARGLFSDKADAAAKARDSTSVPPTSHPSKTNFHLFSCRFHAVAVRLSKGRVPACPPPTAWQQLCKEWHAHGNAGAETRRRA